MKAKQQLDINHHRPQTGTILRATSIFLALLLFSLAFVSSARATAYVSANTGNWSVTTSWNPNGTPGVGDSVRIQNGNIVTNDTAGLSVDSVTIDAGGTFTLGASATVGWMLNNGTLKIGNNTSARTLSFAGSFTNHATITTASTTPSDAITFTANGFWVGSGDISGVKAGVNVNAGVTLDLTGITNALIFKSAGTLALNNNGTLIAGPQVISGNGNATCSFKQNAGALLVTANPNGIINGTLGTINMLGTSTFDPGANYTFNGTAAQVTAGLPATVNNLTITNAAGVTLSTPTMVNGTLALAGGVLTTSSGATPTNAAVTATGGSYVSGPLAMVYSGAGSKTFPIGMGGNARSVTLNYTALDNPSTVTIAQVESAMAGTLPASTAQFASRYWTISQTGGSVLAYNLTLDGTGYAPANTAVLLQQGSPDTSYSTTFVSPNYTATGLTTFGNFTLGNYAPGADKLAITTSAQTLTAGVASGTITVQLQNSGGTPKTYSTNLTINLSSTSGAGLFRDTGDTTTVTTVTIVAGNNSASFKYKDTLAPATPTLTASTTGGVTPATQQETVNVAGANQLAFTTQPVNGNFNYPMSTVVVQVEDQYGNLVPQSGTAITLTLNNGGSSVLTGSNPQSTGGGGGATFNDLSVVGAPVHGLSLTATGGGLIQAVSSNFDMTSRLVEKARVTSSTTLDQGGSWTGGVVPGTNDTAMFDNNSVGSTTSLSQTDVGSDASWYGILVSGWTSLFSYAVTDVGGGHTITLGAAGLVGTNLTRSFTNNNAFALGANQTWVWGDTNSLPTGSLILNGNVDNGGHQFPLNATEPVILNADLTGAGGLTKTGPGSLTVNASVSYTGSTVVSNGTLVLGTSGYIANSPSLVIGSSGTLAGNGVVNNATTNNGTLAPGANKTSLGTLTFNNGITLNAGSTNLLKLKRSLSPPNDVISVPAAIAAAGALVVTNIGTTLVLDDSFTLFSMPVTGSFASLTLPALPVGYGWTNRLAIDGSIAVISVPVNTTPTNITVLASGGNLLLSWPADHTGWRLLVQTNHLASGISSNTNDWMTVPGSTGTNQSTVPIDATMPAEFYRLVYP